MAQLKAYRVSFSEKPGTGLKEILCPSDFLFKQFYCDTIYIKSTCLQYTVVLHIFTGLCHYFHNLILE